MFLTVVFGVAAVHGAQWAQLHTPTTVAIGNSAMDGDEFVALHHVVSGGGPGYTLDTQALTKFDAFNPVDMAVILYSSTIPTDLKVQSLNNDVHVPSIELSQKEDGESIINGRSDGEKVLVLSAETNIDDHIKTIMNALQSTYGDNFMLSIVANGKESESSVAVDRQILATDAEKELLSTEPRNKDFGVIFIICAAFVIAMIFSLVFISYELATMGPGDNIAYKLGAAASKKNQ